MEKKFELKFNPQTEDRKALIFAQELRRSAEKFVIRLNDAVVICDVEIINIRREGNALEVETLFRTEVEAGEIGQTKRVDIFGGRDALDKKL